MKDKPIHVAFANPKIERSFEKLRKGTFEEKQLNMFIERAIKDLKKNQHVALVFQKNYGQNPIFNNITSPIYGNMIFLMHGDLSIPFLRIK